MKVFLYRELLVCYLVCFFGTEQGGKGSEFMDSTGGTCQKLLGGFCPLRGYPSPPPTPNPLTENYFAKKTLAERGGTTPPSLTESLLSFSGNLFPKRAKDDVFSLNKVKNGPFNGPKRAKDA